MSLEKYIEKLKDNNNVYQVPLSKEVQIFLENNNLSRDIIKYFELLSFNSWIKIGYITFNKVNDVISENSDDEFKSLLERGYINIGIGLNGDFIVLDVKNCSIGYIFHDSLYEQSYDEINEIYVDCKIDFIGFIKQAFDNNFPVDGFEAEEQN